MPRPKRPGAPEPKKRSRNGCWPCKARKVKCGEEHPVCINCQRTGETCDYSVRLNWEGRKKKNAGFETILSFQTESPTNTHHARRQSDAKSSSSTTTSTRTQGRPSISNVSHQMVSRPARDSATISFNTTGLDLFVNTSLNEYGRAESDAPLGSQDFASPLLTLPPLYSDELASFNHPPVPPAPAKSEGSSGKGRAPRPPPFKRLRYSADADFHSPQHMRVPSPTASMSGTASPSVTPRFTSGTGPSTGLPTGLPTAVGSPVTPTAESSLGDDERRPSSRTMLNPSPDVRSMSVNSLLSGPPGPDSTPYSTYVNRGSLNAKTPLCLNETTTYWGIDFGFQDLDVGKNDDQNAINGLSPKVSRTQANIMFNPSDNEFNGEFGLSITSNDVDNGTGGYYQRPVPIRIPRELEPLPSKLRDNPMNLLYFHHFMNHTAKILVPHDDQHSNPFRHVLPQMAVENDNLLSLLLAYSASHRARLLQQPEPRTRIAFWVQDIFPALRAALNDPNQSISNANIATAIMLCSLEIVSPTAFGYQIPWQKHLGLARDLIASRPGGLRWTRHWTQQDQVNCFLFSWLAYLDVLGTLSGGRTGSSTAWILDYEQDESEENLDEIDCTMGMTTRCVYILAKIAELAKECDAQRIGTGHTIVADWKPSPGIITRAWTLEDDMKRSMALRPQPCKHLHFSGGIARWDGREMAATNEAFHWAGLVHVHRRVLGKPSGHEDVQAAILKIHSCLDFVAFGTSAEASLLFPIFTAGCDTSGEFRRAKVLERFTSLERSGMMQVQKAKSLMKKVWETGQPWETLLSTEFIG